MGKSILFYLILLTTGIMALKILVLLLEPHLTFYPTKGTGITPTERGISFREINLKTDDGETIYAWFLEHDHPQAEVVFFHGNAGNLSLWLEVLAKIHDHKFNVLALDYRGYGKSSGSPTEKGLYLDTETLTRYFWEQIHRPKLPAVYWGRSLGGVAAAYATTIREPDGIILESTFPDKKTLLKYHPILRVLGFFSRYQLSTADFLSGLSCPALVIHGDRDHVVPFSVGKQLFERLGTKKYFYSVTGARHNDLSAIGQAEYWEHLKRFVKELTNR